jgi:hypothetical protein
MTTARNNDSAGGHWRSKRNRRPRHRRYGVRIGDSPPTKKLQPVSPLEGNRLKKIGQKPLLLDNRLPGVLNFQQC